MVVEKRVPKTWFCPRCDRPFVHIQSSALGKAMMIEHLKKVHKDYYETMYKE